MSLQGLKSLSLLDPHASADLGSLAYFHSPAWSHRMGKSLALVHLAPDAADVGTALEVVGEDASYGATVERIPFYDPDKARTHAP
ncbi:glycine cleavage T C-terminal barrel domain-containing protein [Candidatus Poriferisodalis sp.]|uniref:glycine cleavage T C-terminal barrel domain-containing protein n=1 Tax=Candidatus Poriferisodalis sp. TaxID=3101277 RepID=UPI003B59AC64